MFPGQIKAKYYLWIIIQPCVFEMKIGFDSVFFNWFSQGIITHQHVSSKLGQFNVCVPGDEIILTSNTLVSSGTQVTQTPPWAVPSPAPSKKKITHQPCHSV